MKGTSRSLDLLANFALDVWLLARFSSRIEGETIDGRSWERAVACLLYRSDFSRRQGPGSLGLFGSRARSGVTHEIDGAAESWHASLVVECKSTTHGVSKADVASFHYKLMDFYLHRIDVVWQASWWPLMCSTSPSPTSARATASSLGLLICDSGRLPLPVLVRAAYGAAARVCFPQTLLREIIRLGEKALCPLQERLTYRASLREVVLKPSFLHSREIESLLSLEDEASSLLLALYKSHGSDALERQAENLIWHVRKVI
jgi:hypothetical protein